VRAILEIAYSFPVLSSAVKRKISFERQYDIGDRGPLDLKTVSARIGKQNKGKLKSAKGSCSNPARQVCLSLSLHFCIYLHAHSTLSWLCFESARQGKSVMIFISNSNYYIFRPSSLAFSLGTVVAFPKIGVLLLD
jgi:hypothetical protein